MKNLLLVFATLLIIISCSHQETFEEKIVGEWLTYSFVINCQDASLNTPLTMAEEDGCIELWGSTQCNSIKLSSDGTGQIRSSVENEEDFIQDITYTTDEAKQAINICFGGPACEEFTFKNNRLLQIMDEDDCLCEFEFDRKD